MIDFKLGITWLFDKLGYMPKIVVDAGVLEAWPFPAPKEEPKTPVKKPAVKKAATKKPTLKKTTTRKPKAK